MCLCLLILPSYFSAPVAQLPERDASNVGGAGESPAGSANSFSRWSSISLPCPVTPKQDRRENEWNVNRTSEPGLGANQCAPRTGECGASPRHSGLCRRPSARVVQREPAGLYPASHQISAEFRSVTGRAHHFEPLNAKQLERSRSRDVSRWKRPARGLILSVLVASSSQHACFSSRRSPDPAPAGRPGTPLSGAWFAGNSRPT